MNLREKGTLRGTKIPNSSILYPIGQSQQLWGRGQKVATLLPIMQCSLGSYRRRRHIQIEFVVRYLPRSQSFNRVLQFSHLPKNLYFQLKLDQVLELLHGFKLVFSITFCRSLKINRLVRGAFKEQNVRYYLVVHLFRAVKHVHHNSKSSSQILGGLGFTSSRWAGWRSAHSEMKRLGQSDVTP